MSRTPFFIVTVSIALLTSSAVAGAQDKSRVSQKQARPAAPTSVKAAITAEGTITVTWDAVRGATRYDIGRITATSGWRAIARVPGSSTEFVDQGLDLAQPHQYRVVAVVGDLASPPAMSEQVARGLGGGSVGSSEIARICAPPEAGYIVCQKIAQWIGGLPRGLTLSLGCPAGSQFVSGGYQGQLTGAEVHASRPGVGRDGPIWQVDLRKRELTAEERASTLTPILVVGVLCRVG